MMWPDNLTAQSGDFSTIQSLLTQQNGIVLEQIYSALESWLAAQPDEALTTVEHIISRGLAVNCTAGDCPGLNADSAATLQGLGLIRTSDSIHIQPTMLGWQFIQAMRNI